MVVYPYRMASKSAKALAQALGVKRVRENGKFRNKGNHLLINWGNPRQPSSWEGVRWLNKPNNVAVSHNKLLAFLFMKENARIPEFSCSIDQAYAWVEEGDSVLCRRLLKGHSGKGIVVSTNPEEIVTAPLYVKYIKKQTEYRVHVCSGKVIDAQEKRVRSGSEGNNFQIRNHDTGWVFCRDNVHPQEDVLVQSIRAVEALCLNFGAVDVGWNEYHQQATVYEVNSAPGLEGTTLDKYVQAIKEIV